MTCIVNQMHEGAKAVPATCEVCGEGPCPNHTVAEEALVRYQWSKGQLDRQPLVPAPLP